MSFKYSVEKFPMAGVSRMLATYGGAHILSVVLDEEEILWNGAIIGVGDYAGFENYEEDVPTAFTGKIIDKAANGNWYVQVETANNAFLVYNPPVVEAEYNNNFTDEKSFCLMGKNGDLARAHELKKYDVFELSADGFKVTDEKNIKKGATISGVTGKKPTIAE